MDRWHYLGTNCVTIYRKVCNKGFERVTFFAPASVAKHSLSRVTLFPPATRLMLPYIHRLLVRQRLAPECLYWCRHDHAWITSEYVFENPGKLKFTPVVSSSGVTVKAEVNATSAQRPTLHSVFDALNTHDTPIPLLLDEVQHLDVCWL